jgi:hypothetical protein
LYTKDEKEINEKREKVMKKPIEIKNDKIEKVVEPEIKDEISL